MSVAILEAMASGLYVFVTPVSSNAEVIINKISGEIIECGDYQTLAKQLITYYQEKFLQNVQIPDKTMEDFRRTYNNKVMIEAYHDMIMRMMKVND